jgi:hypothetical protein
VILARVIYVSNARGDREKIASEQSCSKSKTLGCDARCRATSFLKFAAAKSRYIAQKQITAVQQFGCLISNLSLQGCRYDVVPQSVA